jgi:hypothetical protein
MSGVCASARETPKIGPYVSFMATKAAAMPEALLKNFRREVPNFLAISEPMAFTLASYSLCFGVCREGMNSSLETH